MYLKDLILIKTEFIKYKPMFYGKIFRAGSRSVRVCKLSNCTQLPYYILNLEKFSELDELNEKVQFSSKVCFLANFELNLAHFSKKELELN